MFNIRKRVGKLLCNCGSHDFKLLNTLNSYNSHIVGHENLRLVGNLDMPIEFVHIKCRRCDLEIDEISENNLERNKE